MDMLPTFTGFNDPYGKATVAGNERVGPVLSLLSLRKFDLVVLFATPRMASLTEETAKAISGGEVIVRSVHLPDPTDYLAILGELRRDKRRDSG